MITESTIIYLLAIVSALFVGEITIMIFIGHVWNLLYEIKKDLDKGKEKES